MKLFSLAQIPNSKFRFLKQPGNGYGGEGLPEHPKSEAKLIMELIMKDDPNFKDHLGAFLAFLDKADMNQSIEATECYSTLSVYFITSMPDVTIKHALNQASRFLDIDSRNTEAQSKSFTDYFGEMVWTNLKGF